MTEIGVRGVLGRAIMMATVVVLGACSTSTPEAAPTTTLLSPTIPPTTAPPTTSARTAASTLSKPTSATVARDSSIVSAEMALAAAKAGAVDRGYFLERLETPDSCRACIGSEWFTRWCAAAGGRIVGTSDADARYFADGGPIYCYPGAKALPALNLNPYVPGPRVILTAVQCIERGRAGRDFTVPATRCPAGATSLGQD